MKKVGLVGGTGYESTLVYYRELNKRVYEKTNGKEFPEIAIDSVDLVKALSYVEDKNYSQLRYYLRNNLSNLVTSGADVVAFTAGTMHVVYDDLKALVPVPFISIPETVGEEAQSRGYKKVGLLGTKFTMEQDFLKKSFVNREIEVVVPSKQGREVVNDIIYNELEHGVIKRESVETLINIITDMEKLFGIEAVVLGCTELPLAINIGNCPIPVLDIMELHINKLVEIITSNL